MFPSASTAGLATGCKLSARRVATAKGIALLCRSFWTIWMLSVPVHSGTTPSNNVGVTSTGRVGVVPKTILHVSNAWASNPVQDTVTCPPRRPACGVTWCKVIGCIILAMEKAYNHDKNRQHCLSGKIIPWRVGQEQRFLHGGIRRPLRAGSPQSDQKE